MMAHIVSVVQLQISWFVYDAMIYRSAETEKKLIDMHNMNTLLKNVDY